MKVLVLDDDTKISNMIKSLLEKYFSKSIKNIDTVTSVEEAVLAIKNNDYQMYLFDIHLGKETSFEILVKLKKQSQINFHNRS
ncbi:MAG: response regulator [Flavobacterium sp.]|nr:response regulator [Flavobacterium sp.]